MKRLLLYFTLLFCLADPGFAQNNPRIEIHHIGAGDGDATLIIAIDSVDATDITGKRYLDTAVILIDGQRSSRALLTWKYISDTLNALSPNLKRIDFIVLTHLHQDHFGGLATIIDNAKKAGWKIGRVLDRQNANYSNYIGATDIKDDCYKLNSPQPVKQSFDKYVNMLRKYKITTVCPEPGNDLFAGKNFMHMSMLCVASIGKTFAIRPDVADTCFLPRSGQSYYDRSENDLSIGFLIEFQGFHYLTLGDLGGIQGGYTDGETPVTNALKSFMGTGYHICANKVSHHGSEESTSQWFATTNNFTVSVIPASLRSFGKSENALPTEPAIMNLKNTKKDTLLYTFIPKNPGTLSSYWTKGNFDKYNDVVLKIVRLPGYGQNVSMQVIQRPKSKQGAVGTATSQTIICNKGHNDD